MISLCLIFILSMIGKHVNQKSRGSIFWLWFRLFLIYFYFHSLRNLENVLLFLVHSLFYESYLKYSRNELLFSFYSNSETLHKKEDRASGNRCILCLAVRFKDFCRAVNALACHEILFIFAMYLWFLFFFNRIKW